MNIERLNLLYSVHFSEQPTLFYAPGRINLIGEHTDYNEGFVLPAAIDKACYIAIAKNGTNGCNLVAHDLDERYSFDIESDLNPVEKGWVNYFLGVIQGFKSRGIQLSGFNLVVTSNVPLGAGLSSSAAIESSFGVALNELFDANFSLVEIAQIGQKAEHNYAGVMCGIMDQYASCLGKENQAILLDCRSLEHQLVPIDIEDYHLVLFDTKVKHNLASSEYNTRRRQCEQGVSIIQEKYPKVKSLRDVTVWMMKEFKSLMNPVVFKRCDYVVRENERVQAAVEMMRSGDVHTLGKLMFETHHGLSEDYEVSCSELDCLIDLAKENEHIIGARMMGGGFGGCTLNLVSANHIDEVIAEIERKYEQRTNSKPESYRVRVSDGAKKI